MRISLGSITACLAAASLVSLPAFAQQHAREAQTFVLPMAGSYLGVGAMDVTSERARALNLKEERGVEISSIEEDGPAAKAGLQKGDVVLEFNGQQIEGLTQFRRMVQETPAGRQVKLGVWRNGAMQNITATVGERKNTGAMMLGPDGGNWNFTMPTMPSMPEMPNIEIPRMMISRSGGLGIMGESLHQEDQLAEFFGVQDGVLVRSVTKGSAADKAGIKAGDVITKVDDSKVISSADISRILRGARSKKTVNVIVVRNKKEMPLTVTVETAGNTFRALAQLVNC